jgi:hypothetical protein
MFTTLVGLKLEDVKRFKNVKFKFFVLHLPDNLNSTKIPINDQYKNVLVETLQTTRVDQVSIHNENLVSCERAGLSRDAPKRNLHGWFYCCKLEYPQFVLLPNCDVVLCGMDFALENILGNLLVDSYEDILASPKLQTILKDRHKFSSHTICRRCTGAEPLHKHQFYKLAQWVYRRLKNPREDKASKPYPSKPSTG